MASPSRSMPAASPTAERLARQTSLTVMPGVWRAIAAGERGTAAGVLPVRGLEDIAEHDVVRLQPGSAVESGSHRRGAQLDAAVVLPAPL